VTDEDRVAAGRTVARRWAPVAAVAGVVVVVTAVAVPVARHRPPVPVGGGASSPPRPGRGAQMEGLGTLVRDGNGQVRLCAEAMITGDSPPPAVVSCTRVAVPTTGVDDRWLAKPTKSGQRYSPPVRVEGTYAGGVLAVTRVAEMAPDAVVEPPVPCPAPAGGWRPGPGYSEGSQAEDSRYNGLVFYVHDRADRFGFVWDGHPEGAPQIRVAVVGTTGDPAAAEAELSAIYPGNLCVPAVPYSQNGLARIERRLDTVTSIPIDAWPDLPLGKVRVSVVALDPATNAVLDTVDREALVVDPLLKWLE
jgi:hypothetical protein